MWQCVKCGEEVEESLDVCWNCGTSPDGTEDPAFQRVDEEPPESIDDAPLENSDNPIMCPRCRRELTYVGTKAFHEGTRWGILGEFGELFVSKERFDVYCCPRCGRVEFFVNGIGEEFRPR